MIQPWLSFITASSSAINQNLSHNVATVPEDLKSPASDTAMAKFHYHQLGCNQSKLEPHCGISTDGSEISSKLYRHGWISLPPALLQSIKIWAAPWNQYRRIWNLRQVIQPWLSFINASSAATNQNLSRTVELISEELKSAASDTITAEFLYHYLCCKQSKSELHCGISTGEQKWSPAATQLLFTNNKIFMKMTL